MNQLNYSISPRSKRIMLLILKENPILERIISKEDFELSNLLAKRYIDILICKRPGVKKFILKSHSKEVFKRLTWSDYALLRIHNYLKYGGQTFVDLNIKSKESLSDPLKIFWFAYHYGTGGGKFAFFTDMHKLLIQIKAKKVKRKVSIKELKNWMALHPSGMDEDLIIIRNQNKERIIRKFVELQEKGFYKPSRKYSFPKGATLKHKIESVYSWWDDYRFHLHYAIRDYKTLYLYLDKSLTDNKMDLFRKASRKGLPFFVNFHYLSLLITKKLEGYVGADMPIRDYIFYNEDLINEFGHIVAWEKEDIIEAGKPNAAGWLLPNDKNIHRRYPEVAIFIPDSMGRSCGGLCVSCQRMYDFQKGHLNFNLDKLRPRKSWAERLRELLTYFEEDKQLKDILITGGDSLMSSNTTLRNILEEVYQMSKRKKQANIQRPVGEKYAEMVRIRLGTRMPVYIPQRIDEELVEILKEFKQKAKKIGIQQFVIQTHFVSSMEITPQSKQAIRRLLSSGWMVTNQAVFTTSVSRRGHMAKLRFELNKLGVLPYYTFSVKGFRENRYNFVPNARLAQEAFEEKFFGNIEDRNLMQVTENEDYESDIREILNKRDLPFLATDRLVMNLPALGKSLTYSVIGITNDGRRILKFNHDSERRHSPVVQPSDEVIIVESKSITHYLKQLEKKGCLIEDYENIYGYSMFTTEKRKAVFKYPDSLAQITKEINHFSRDMPI
ncbi:MAG: KamA family protein [Bacteroidetes bacterium]|nr:MAG: KamA family protein [Bacteroidota bacterium]